MINNRGLAEPALEIEPIIDKLVAKLEPLRFKPPIACVYNPLVYARAAHLAYWRQYGAPPKEVMFLGMNPGPWGMAQTGIPFGDVAMVTQWLGLRHATNVPEPQHPKRPVQGLDCVRSEISGKRFWGWARERFHTPRRFFKRFWVANYCPLVFMEASGRNRTPDKLPSREKEPLLAACDVALVQTVQLLQPRWVVGIGQFATQQARRALADQSVKVGQVTHPSPANPKANKGWCNLIENELRAMGIALPDVADE